MKTEALFYRDEGIRRELKGCKLTEDNNGRFWLWCEQLGHNLAYKEASREDALIRSIRSLLFDIELKNKQIEELKEVYNLAMQLADRIKPDNED